MRAIRLLLYVFSKWVYNSFTEFRAGARSKIYPLTKAEYFTALSFFDSYSRKARGVETTTKAANEEYVLIVFYSGHSQSVSHAISNKSALHGHKPFTGFLCFCKAF